jgi:CubicO group peptidase (beta-lactamase class C family)
MLIAIYVSCCFNVLAQKTEYYGKPKNLIELKSYILQILKKTNTPGAGVVMVSGDNTICFGLGKADIENNIDVNKNTIFRLGSVSKIFPALAVLKLQEEGRLSLKDKIKDLIPEIKFNNPWEDKHPIRVENLLEHTTGWKYMTFAELGNDDPKPKTLKEALELYPRSRTSRFIPGTRIGYSNIGTSVAAYVVEKVSGMTFEQYIDKYFFKPMGIENMTYLQTEEYKKHGAKLYANGLKLDYYNIIYRPSAALNASPKDLAKMLKFFLNRGKANENQILSDSSLQRMERSESLPKMEIYKYYGLSNFSSYYKGFLYHGHGGSVPGGNADFEYLPEYNVGYAVMINGDNEEVLNEISEMIKDYQTKDLVPVRKKSTSDRYKIKTNPSGFYTMLDNDKLDQFQFIEKIKNIIKVKIKNDTLYVRSLFKGNSTKDFIPASVNEFRSTESNQIELALINDPLDGKIICYREYFKKIPAIEAYFLIFIFWAFPITIFLTIVLSVIWVVTFLSGKNKSKLAFRISLFTLIPNIFVLLAYFVLSNIPTRLAMFKILGTINVTSVFLYGCGLCYALASLWSIFYIVKYREKKMPGFFYYYFVFASVMNFIFTFYFINSGLIGIPTWS